MTTARKKQATKRSSATKKIAKKATAKTKAPAKKSTTKAKPKKKAASKQKASHKSAATPHNVEVPFRKNGAYAAVFSILYAHKDKGITRKQLVEDAVKATGKDEKRSRFDIAVVTSPSKDGKAHRSANRAADSYWVEKSDGGNLKLHMR